MPWFPTSEVFLASFSSLGLVKVQAYRWYIYIRVFFSPLLGTSLISDTDLSDIKYAVESKQRGKRKKKKSMLTGQWGPENPEWQDRQERMAVLWGNRGCLDSYHRLCAETDPEDSGK